MNKTHHRIALAAAVVYLAGVMLIVFWPAPVDRPASGQLHMVLTWLHNHGMPRFIGYGQVEFTANVGIFIPMGYIASAWFRKFWPGIFIGFLASCVIELGQAIFLPDRFATGMDVLANTIGAGIGAALYYGDHRSRTNSATSRMSNEPSQLQANFEKSAE
ncbi:VanZ like family protein [Arthrobacter alpinus]|uniref:VanZ like family protein n=1 Tax=Arthrobacter alpinus TaxID=656366 RepID=A0A1H5KGE5_9MICC|nr:VanZ family protein [Arthrobacter alpinus]SEE63926.1 VanZ like family protein [Arthrobacter alpinus]